MTKVHEQKLYNETDVRDIIMELFDVEDVDMDRYTKRHLSDLLSDRGGYRFVCNDRTLRQKLEDEYRWINGEEDIRELVESQDKFYSSSRTSKVDKWVSRIEDDEATLEDARGHMSTPTWYKVKNRVE